MGNFRHPEIERLKGYPDRSEDGWNKRRTLDQQRFHGDLYEKKNATTEVTTHKKRSISHSLK